MGLRSSICARIVSCAMLIVFPSALFGGESNPGAMLYTHGDAILNGNSVPRSSALFFGDWIQTRADSVANINAAGSTVLILNDSIVEYDGNSLKLEHGGVTISTSKSMAVRAGVVSVSPKVSALTEFEVRDVDGTVQIAARKGELSISDDKGASTTLAEGQETTRDQSETNNDSKRKRAAAGAAPVAGAALDSPVAIGIGAGAIVGLGIWVLIQGNQPVSPQ
jgi:hypothetical protein